MVKRKMTHAKRVSQNTQFTLLGNTFKHINKIGVWKLNFA